MLERYPTLDFDGLAKSADAGAFDRLLEKTGQGITEWAGLLKGDAALRAIDENPFVKTSVVATLGDGLRNVVKELKLSGA
jgi:hypothetical protein